MLFAVLSEEGESSLSTATSRHSSIHPGELSPTDPDHNVDKD